VVFGGAYRIIDFTLSNCVHSGIQTVGIITQYEPRSLNQHIRNGRPWDLDRAIGGVYLLQPYIGRRVSEWYKGTADAVYQNLLFAIESHAEQVLILSGDHIYNMRYNDMVSFHREKEADCTIGVVPVPIKDAPRYGMLEVNQEGEIVGFEEKPVNPTCDLASMGIYLFNKDVLIDKLCQDAENSESTHDFGTDIIPSMLGKYRVCGYRFDGFWRDVGTVHSYWEANMELVADLPRLNLYDLDHPVLTRPQNRPPMKSGPRAHISRSLVSDGCIVNGIVYNSVLSPGVYVEEGAVVEESILFDDCYIARGAHVHRSILDKEVYVGYEAHVGCTEDYSPNDEEPQHLSTGITLVGKRVQIPPSTRIGRNCKIYPGILGDAFPSDTIPSGRTVRNSRSD
jgi:glucose-1-phosphate adenylyltransferase